MKALVVLALLAVAATPDGKSVYTGKCARCHKLYDPAKYDEKAWDTWMQKMKIKTRLSDEQTRQLSEYIQTLRTKK